MLDLNTILKYERKKSTVNPSWQVSIKKIETGESFEI